MDIVSHGLWGGAAFGRKSKRSFWLAFLFGVLPDLIPFSLHFVKIFLGLAPRPDFNQAEPPDPSLIPEYVRSLYSATHSLVVFAAIFLIIFFVFKKQIWEILAWPLHILVDIPTHSYKFFPTPFLWPVSSYKFNGWQWADPWIFFPDVALLIFVYLWIYVIRRRRV